MYTKCAYTSTHARHLGSKESCCEPSETGVELADAAVALEDENALTIIDDDHEELRFRTLAMSPSADVLYIVHAESIDDNIRVISARSAEKREERIYYQGGFE